MPGWLQDWWGGVRAGWLIRRYDPIGRMGSLRFTRGEDPETSLRTGLDLTNAAWYARRRP